MVAEVSLSWFLLVKSMEVCFEQFCFPYKVCLFGDGRYFLFFGVYLERVIFFCLVVSALVPYILK